MGVFSRAAGDERSQRSVAGSSGDGTVADHEEIDDGAFDDPESVKVHYDLRSWTDDGRGELVAALAAARVMHRWEGAEVVVLEVHEPLVDDIVDQLDRRLGPFAVVLDGDGVEFALDEFDDRDRRVLTSALVDAGIAHRWEGDLVIVDPADAEDVDDLVDAVENGDIAIETDDDDDVDGDAGSLLSDLFTVADRLGRDPVDTSAQRKLAGLLDTIDPDRPPFGITLRSWSVICDAAVGLGATFDEFDPETVAAAGGELRTVLRPFV